MPSDAGQLDLSGRPEYARIIIEGYTAKGWSQARFAKEAGIDKAFMNRIAGGRDIPGNDLLERFAEKLGFDIHRTDTLKRVAGAEFAKRNPEEADRQDAWLKFHMVEAYADFHSRKGIVPPEHPWHDYADELERVVKYSNAHDKGESLTVDKVMESLVRGCRAGFRAIIKRADPGAEGHFTSPEALAKALIDAVDMTLEETSERMGTGEGYLHTILNPKARRTPTHAQTWSRLADALMLDVFGLKEDYLRAVRQLRRSQLPPLRTVTQIADSMRPDDTAAEACPPVMDVLRALAQERTGDGWFLSRAEIERQAGVSGRMLKDRKHVPESDEPLITICRTLEIPPEQEQQIMEMAASERAKGASWALRSNSLKKGETPGRPARSNHG